MASKTGVAAGRPRVDIVEFSIATVAGLALAFTTLFLCVVPWSGNVSGSRDYVVFWATGQQLMHHANPYDPVAMKQIEQGAGLNTGYSALFMRNPPWGLPLVVPLGLVGLRLGAVSWSLVIVGCLVISVRMLWRMEGRPRNLLHWLGLSFGPALICAMMGQTTLFALLGYVLFVYLHGRQPFLAGMSLWLCALKPHLLLPFGVALLAWIVFSKSYKVLAGTAVAMAGSCALAYMIDPAAWSEYGRMMHSVGLGKEYVPCLIVVLRLWLSPQSMWMQSVPPALGCAWALAYFWGRRHAWDWNRNGHLVVVVSLLAAPYSWVYDDGLAIPALLQGAYRTKSRLMLVLFAVASLAIQVELVSGIKVTSAYYLWTAPACFVWYLFARAPANKLAAHEGSGTESLPAQGD